MFRQYSSFTPCVLCLLAIPAFGTSATKPAAQTTQPAEWTRPLHIEIVQYLEGNHRAVFERISTRLQTSSPSPDVHRCLALLRVAFLKLNSVDPALSNDPIKWPAAARGLFARLEQSTKDSDAVTLAVLKYDPMSRKLTSEPVLERIIDAKGPWCDWAQWELARIQADKVARTRLDSTGVINLDKSGGAEWICLSDNPALGIRFRAAYRCLSRHSGSYMRMPMLRDIAQWRHWSLQYAFDHLNDYPVQFPQSNWPPYRPGVMAEVANMQHKINETLDSQFSEKEKAMAAADGFLDSFLWGDHEFDNYLFYVEQIVQAREQERLPEEALKWASEKRKTTNVRFKIVEPDK